MRLNSIKPSVGATKNRKRVGRGIGSGTGKTCGRGHKGQKSRAGGFHKVGFEGGQMPLQRRVPKFGFKNNNKVVSKPINLDDLQKLSEAKKLKEVTPEILRENGLAQKNDVIKVLGRGELKAGLKVTAHKFSKTAQEAIEKAGGSITIVE